jgi:DNA-binding transcriptional ArsR family regulator
MNEKICLRDFPEFVRLEVSRDLSSKIFNTVLENIKEETVDADCYEEWPSNFFYGKIGGKILEALKQGTLTGREIIEKTGISKNTFYHKIAELKKEGIVKGRYEITGLRPKFSYLYSFESLSPNERRSKGISKEDVIIALYLWPKYKEACLKERISPSTNRYSVGYRDLFSLAQAIKTWKKGDHMIPKWVLIALAEASNQLNLVESEGAILSYSLPPGIKVAPYYEGKYKIPIDVGVELDIATIQFLVKGTESRRYNHKNKEHFFEKLFKTFGVFPQNDGRVPGVILEIIKKHYNVCISKENARIPELIFKKLEELKDPEKMQKEIELLEGILELGSHSNGYVEITCRSENFFKDLSQITESVGIGELNIRNRRDRPHFRSELSIKKFENAKKRLEHIKEIYAKIDQIYPDIRVWENIPLNKIREKIRTIDGDIKKLEEICKEELATHLNSALESIYRNKPIYRRVVQSSYLKQEMMEYFWTNKKIPSTRNVQEFLSNKLAETPFIHRVI